jgi:hypothetical protein
VQLFTRSIVPKTQLVGSGSQPGGFLPNYARQDNAHPTNKT